PGMASGPADEPRAAVRLAIRVRAGSRADQGGHSLRLVTAPAPPPRETLLQTEDDMPQPDLDPAVLEALRRYDTPTMSNAIETFDLRPRATGYASQDVRCLFPDLGVMVGYAATAVIRARGEGTGDPAPL